MEIITFGKPKNKNILKLEEHYKKLISKYRNIQYSVKITKEVKISQEIIEKNTQNNHIIILSETGTQKSTVEFSHYLQNLEITGKKTSFVIGNSFGFEKSAIDKAHFVLSLSKMTFPHDIAYILLLEQLYRCYNLLEGGSYHK